MTICHTPGCPTSHDLDKYGRRMSVEHNGLTQSLLGPTGHHLLNRQLRGELEVHLANWSPFNLARAEQDIDREEVRVRQYLNALEKTRIALWHRRDELETR